MFRVSRRKIPLPDRRKEKELSIRNPRSMFALQAAKKNIILKIMCISVMLRVGQQFLKKAYTMALPLSLL